MQSFKSLLLVFVFAFTLLAGCQFGEKKYYAEIQTDMGKMKVELYNSTPIHRDNFIKLVEEQFYDGLLFHRVIQGFMIQGGDPESKHAIKNQRLGMGGPGYTLPNEIGAPHFRGTLAAARTGGASNPEKRSSGSQFYIVQGRKQDEQSLRTFGSMKGITYNEVQRKKYINEGGAPSLDTEYTVFGELVEGFDVLDKIASFPTDPFDRPLEDIEMTIKMVK